MENEEKKEQNESEIRKEEDIEVHSLIQDVGELIGCIFFIVFFGGGGTLALMQKDSDMGIKIVGGLFIIFSIGLLYKLFCCIKDIKENISSMKRKTKKVITLRNIGYFIYSMAIMTIMIMFIKMIVTPNSESITKDYDKYLMMIIIEGITGTVLMYIDAIVSVVFNKKTNIVEIDKNENEE